MRGFKKFCLVLVVAKGQFQCMKIPSMMISLLAFGSSCLMGHTHSPDPQEVKFYKTECFVVNHTSHPIHLAFYDAHQNLWARESDHLVLPGDSLNFGVWSDREKFIDPLDSVNIVITSDKRKWAIRSVLMRESPRVHEPTQWHREIYYAVEWSRKPYYR